jgi:hypothetical protein
MEGLWFPDGDSCLRDQDRRRTQHRPERRSARRAPDRGHSTRYLSGAPARGQRPSTTERHRPPTLSFPRSTSPVPRAPTAARRIAVPASTVPAPFRTSRPTIRLVDSLRKLPAVGLLRTGRGLDQGYHLGRRQDTSGLDEVRKRPKRSLRDPLPCSGGRPAGVTSAAEKASSTHPFPQPCAAWADGARPGHFC